MARMGEFRVAVTGGTEEIDALEQFCVERGLESERGVVSEYEGVAVSVLALFVSGTFEEVVQGIAAYGASQPPPFNARYFVSQKGHQVIKDYRLETVAEVLSQTEQLHFDRYSQQLRMQHGP
jgi:hypothetical protein